MSLTNDFNLPLPLPEGITDSCAQETHSKKLRPYLRGPITWDWLSQAIALGHSALSTALALWHLRSLNRDTTFTANLRGLGKCTGLSEKATRSGLHALENAGLVSVDRPVGRNLTITLPHQAGNPAADALTKPTNFRIPPQLNEMTSKNKFEHDPIARAKQHYRDTKGSFAIQPDSVRHHEVDGQDFVVLYTSPKILAVYESLRSGALIVQERWPAELDDLYGIRRKKEAEPIQTRYQFGAGIRASQSRPKTKKGKSKSGK